MKKMFVMTFVSLIASASFAALQDLSLPGEKWVATFDKYICAAFGEAVARPAPLEEINVTFDRITTDATLDNALLRATFVENGVTCRYNAILLADNTAQTSSLVQSIAYNPEGGAAAYAQCVAGKAVLDKAFAANKYLYYGHPHNLAFMMPGIGADAVCGNGAETMGANFVVRGKLSNQ